MPTSSTCYTLITLGVSIFAKPLVLKARKRVPRGFDSHRPLHFSLAHIGLHWLRASNPLTPWFPRLDSATAEI
jgi:hypothetical protein